VDFDADLREDLGLPTCQMVLSSGTSVENARAALLAEFEKIASKPITERELTTAKNQLLSEKLHERETADGKAEAVAEAAVLLGDAELVNRELADLQAVTIDKVQAVAKEWFTDKNRLVIEYLPAAMKPKSESGTTKPGTPAVQKSKKN
jgi:zinc protease